MPLIGATQGQHNWWTKGLVGSRKTLRNWTGGWTTWKSAAQEGRKVKPIHPTTPSRSTDRKTIRTNLTRFKPAENVFFLLSSFPPESFFLSVLLSFFISSSFHPLLFLFLLPTFFYLSFYFNFCWNSFLSFLWSCFYSFFLPFFYSFSIPFFTISLLFFFSFFLFFSHRWDNKTWRAEKIRVRPC